jgi:hypothetical protein
MTRIDQNELISYDQVKHALETALMDISKIENLPPLPAKRAVTGVRIQDCSATQDGETIKVQGKGWVELEFHYGNAEIGEIDVIREFPMTYSAESDRDRTLLSCKAVASTREEEDLLFCS